MKPFKLLSSFFLAAGLATTGCGTETSPVASTEPTVTHSADGRTFISFAPEGARRAAKLANEAPLMGTDTRLVETNKGKNFKVQNSALSGAKNRYLMTFHVEPNSVTEDVNITMEAYGETLSELVIAFAPGGLEFLNEAELVIRLGVNRIDLNPATLVINHEHETGSSEVATITELKVNKDDIIVKVAVPGFSRYSGGGGW